MYGKHRRVPGRLYWRSAPSWKPLVLTVKNSEYPDSSSVFDPVQSSVQSSLTGLHEISQLHPAPPWYHLYKEPVLDLSLKYVTLSSDGTLYLRLTFFPLIFCGQEHPHPQYPLPDPDPRRS